MKNTHSFIAILLVLVVLASGCASPKFTTYVSFVPDMTVPPIPGSMLMAQQVLQKRLDLILSGKSRVQLENDTLRVGLTNEKDLPLAITMATQPGLLIFFHSDQPVATGQIMPADAVEIFSGASIANASTSRDLATGWWSVSITLNSTGKTKLAEYTQAHIGAYLVIARDERVISSPQVNAAITGGQAVIAGNFDKASAQMLAAQINSGAMPVPLKVMK